MNKKPYLQFRKDGTFRILHITDLQESIYPRKDTIRLLCALLNNTRPDLMIMTGDQLKGYSPWFRLAGKSGVQNTIKMLTDPMERRRIPYAVTFGNHDIQCGISNEEQAEWYRQQPYGVCPKEGAAAGTFDLTVHRNDGHEALRLYLIDSGNITEHGQYAPPADEVLGWLRERLAGEKLPSMLFQHIPLPEYRKCRHVIVHEPVCVPNRNAGEFDILRANGKVMAVFCGHDHKNDFVGHYICFENIGGKLVEFDGIRENPRIIKEGINDGNFLDSTLEEILRRINNKEIKEQVNVMVLADQETQLIDLLEE